MLTRLSLAITSLALLAAAAALAQDVATHPDFIPSEQLNKQLPDWLRFRANSVRAWRGLRAVAFAPATTTIIC